MWRWVVLFMVGVLFLSNFGFAGQFQEVKDSQVPVSSGACDTCSSCQDFDIDKALGEVNAKIGNLTKVINQKEAELQKLYAELNRTKSIETLEKIIKLEDEDQSLKHDLKAFERRKLSLELIKKYTRKTPYGLQVLYYRLPREDVLVKQYIEKVHPVKKDVDLDWFIAFYRQAGELTFDEYIETGMKLRETLKEVKAGNATIEDALKLIQQRKEIWDRIYDYLEERDRLQTLKKLKELGKQQTIIKTIGVEPLSTPHDFGWYDGWGERWGNCNSGYIPICGNYNLKSWLPESGEDWGENPVYFKNLEVAAVWVGIYTTSEPYQPAFTAQYCTHEFFLPSNEDYNVRVYWDRAIKLMESIGYANFGEYGSIQIKYFYAGEAYNSRPSDRSYQKANLIFQFECNKYACWISSYHPQLPTPSNPYDIPSTGYYPLYVFARAIYANCCIGIDNPECNWANGHCKGCFAPDESASQNFAWENRGYRICVWPPERYGERC